MARDEEQLAPETIEEQLNYLAHALQFMPADAPKTPTMQVIEALEDVYQDERQNDAGSLDRVWNRLTHSRAATFHQQVAPIRQLPITHERRISMRNIFSRQKEGLLASRLGMIAAVTLLVILVGSLSIGVTLFAAHQRAGQPVPTATVLPAVTPTLVPLPKPLLLQTIHMLDEMNGWAITDQGQVLRTSDGATHWQNVTPPGLGSGQPVADFLDASHAWLGAIAPAASGSTQPATLLFRTANGGHTWDKTTFQGDLFPYTPSFINSQDGWLETSLGAAAGSEGVAIYRTTDGGASWINVARALPTSNQDQSALPFGGDKSGISFLNALTGWAIGTSAADRFLWLYITHDGGVTWLHQSLPLPAAVTAQQDFAATPYLPTFYDSQNGSMLIVFDYPGFNPASYYLYVTHDGGASWQFTPQLPLNEINQGNTSLPDFITANQGWLSDGSTLLMTDDGGQHWTKLQTNSTFNYIMELNFVSSTVGWAISYPPSLVSAQSTLNAAARGASRPASPNYSGTYTLIKTVDGGQTWQPVMPVLV